MPDLQKETSHFKEKISVPDGSIYISPHDGIIRCERDVVVSPGQKITLPYEDELLGLYSNNDFNLSGRSSLAQGGLTVSGLSFGARPEVEILNLHPKNEYLFPAGSSRLGRLYLTSPNSLNGSDLSKVVSQIQSEDNTFGGVGLIQRLDGVIELPLLNDYAHEPGVFKVEQPINVQKLSSGTKRFSIKAQLGTREIKGVGLVTKYLENTGLRLLITPYFTVPDGIALVIENSDSLESRVIDPGFKHLVVGEFSDSLLKEGKTRTTDSLLVKAYRITPMPRG